MIDTFRCDDKETLVAYLYGEIDPDRRRDVESHLRACGSCAQEIEDLQAVRQDMASWQPPGVELDFSITPKPATVLRPSRWAAPTLPAWAQVAAAMLVFATGLGIANVHVRYGSDGLTITSGWMTPQAAPAATATGQAAARTDDWRPALAALETDLRRELQMMRSTSSTTSAPAAMDSAAVLRRVRELLDEREKRQLGEFALRLAQFDRELGMQRRADLGRIDQAFSQLEGRTGAVLENQREFSNYLRRVNTQVP